MSEPRCNSYYNATINHETEFPELKEEIRVDVVIVGGGFTGVATALELSEKGYKVALLEANKIGWGATGRNGGQVTGSLSGDEAMTKQLRNRIGSDAEQYVWNMRWRGHEIIKERVKKYDIACDLKFGHIHTAYKYSHLKQLDKTYAEACQRGMEGDLAMLTKSELDEYVNTPLYHGGLLNRRNMHLHSVNLCIGEARAAESLGALIFEHSAVLNIEDGSLAKVTTAKGKVIANRVVIAGNAYHKLARKKLRGMLFPASLGNCATTQLSEELAMSLIPQDVAVYDTRFVLDYYRLTADNRLMFGGGTNYSGRESKDVARELRPALERTFPQLKGIDIEFGWTGMAGIVLNRIPQLGKVSPNVYYSQGYSGHGVATSHIMAEIVANAVAGELHEFDLFAQMSHYRIPLNEWFGNQALALGMMYYKVMENFR
ncbi:NAD(P)/FAD-dependent oxidoreductase [Shewanella fidelis]|uniref:FAD-binding oxidoreductase n=1 Tax=Shewanella fidelis TaxID=173509 RepID=A0AAW8NNC8_9GAMM|nr:FAD-binding oxidoreductase [Shewanella fidelis]MDR8524221.1 FAD-binding oxidoreductase [Shewanella fidelis]MDW4810769.1 FAD-binding oxidoreductase [Shewanella fidelis]MDW4814890.1 FAD-binding oxidoreductase [Shewanella fidelis]MDW4818980.1 FAD-binding oxidoreductase [Shewanella fidelis]MDW4823343.1 FAD-binding oxidoreductase [Shewanella fidelis]